MKKKVQPITYRERRQALVQKCLPRVRHLVKDYDRAAVQGALNLIHDEEKAQKELKAAERKAEELRRKLGKS